MGDLGRLMMMEDGERQQPTPLGGGAATTSTNNLGLSPSFSKLPLLSLNHVSFVCKSVSTSVRFYQDVLGFVLIRRPSSFDFQGAWLFNYGIGIHLLESDDVPPSKKDGPINPKDNHISFQCSDMNLLKKNLQEKNIDYVTAVVEEGGIQVDQIFFHDPDGYMIEICNCDNLPVLPLSSCPRKQPSSKNDTTFTTGHINIPSSISAGQAAGVVSVCLSAGKGRSEMHCSTKVEALMMDSFLMDMISISY